MAFTRLFDCTSKTKFYYNLTLSRLEHLGDKEYGEKARTTMESHPTYDVEDLNQLNKYLDNLLSINDPQGPHIFLRITIKGKIDRTYTNLTFTLVSEYCDFLKSIGFDMENLTKLKNLQAYLAKEPQLSTFVEDSPNIYRIKQRFSDKNLIENPRISKLS